MKRVQPTLMFLLLLTSGCALPTQRLAKLFVDTQKEVKFKDADYADPAKIVLGHAVVYVPRLPKNPDPLMKWLAFQAPIIVQGVQAPHDKPYPRESDEIGMPVLRRNPAGSEDAYTVDIDVKRPAVFARVEKEMVHGQELLQLVYAHWYPNQPVGGIERGKIDSSVLRVTLDSSKRPCVYEHVWACGCYHGSFVTAEAEALAEAEFGKKNRGTKHFMEKLVAKEDDWRIKDIVHTGGKLRRPILFVSTGGHFCVAVQTQALVKNLEKLERREYTLLPYEVLERLPVENETGKTGSMFNRKRLVWGAVRKGEEKMFPAMDHPGWPRHLDVMKLHWDRETWMNPELLSRFLRLPKALVSDSPGTD